MVPTTQRRRSLIGSTLLAMGLAFSTVAAAVGRDASIQAPPFGAAISAIAAAAATLHGTRWLDGGRESRYDGGVGLRASAPGGTERVAPTLATGTRPGPRLATGVGTSAPKATASSYRGRNHVWMPSLGINKSVSAYSCSNASYPGNRVYRWGCAGSNNVYLFGHASSVFKPLHDAYVRGRLQKGAKLFYADRSGTVHTYSVVWWKLTTATKGTWAYSSLARPSLTLQTCIGARNQYRLIVRLVRVD